MADPSGAGNPAGLDYLAPAFYFSVSFIENGGRSDNSNPADNSFLEVAGISAELETEAYREGGENNFEYQLPKGTKYPKLTLKRGIASIKSPLVTWCRDTLEGGLIQPIKTKQIKVSLLDENGGPLRVWSFVNAYPVSWQIEDFKSTKNEVAVEKIEFCYNSSSRIPTPPETRGATRSNDNRS